MASEAELMALASACEKAIGPDDDMFREAFNLCFPKPSRVWQDEDREEWTAEYGNHHNQSWAYETFLEARAYLDAAMTLVPAGRDWMVDNFDGPHDRRCSASVFNAKSDDYADYEACAATPALALCAAALKARAATMGGSDD